MRATLLELAEEPGLWISLAPPSELIVADGYTVVTSLRSASVERIRLAPEDVERAIEETRALARGRGFAHVTWWLGELTTPPGLAGRLEALGFEPDRDTPEMTSLTIDHAPAGEPTVEVRRVETVEEYLRALELDWEVWQVPEDERAGYRPVAAGRLAADSRPPAARATTSRTWTASRPASPAPSSRRPRRS